jgi:methylisocitrate lyase
VLSFLVVVRLVLAAPISLMKKEGVKTTPGIRLRAVLETERPLQIVGTVNPYCAIMAERIGHKALYVSGSGVATASHGLPDLGVTTLNDHLEDTARITSITDLPVLVDVDTGWGNALNVQRTVNEMIRAGAAAMHIEDQELNKRCGHLPGKSIVSKDEMVARIKAAVDARNDETFMIIARTDAAGIEGLDRVIERAASYVEAGADMLFPEALTTLDEYKKLTSAVSVPVLANITEFGKTPLFTKAELAGVGVKAVLYPLSAHRAMAKAAATVYQAILRDGHQKNVLDLMQTRAQLYDFLNYEDYEKRLAGSESDSK